MHTQKLLSHTAGHSVARLGLNKLKSAFVDTCVLFGIVPELQTSSDGEIFQC